MRGDLAVKAAHPQAWLCTLFQRHVIRSHSLHAQGLQCTVVQVFSPQYLLVVVQGLIAGELDEPMPANLPIIERGIGIKQTVLAFRHQ
ncbi:hypothetical protein D3C80_1963760 [compost metagenome]